MDKKYSYIQHVKGHRNSQGEIAEWVIKDHTTDEIISSHKTKEEAEKHLQQMHAFKKSCFSFSRYSSVKELLESNSSAFLSTLPIKKTTTDQVIGKVTVEEDLNEDANEFQTSIKQIELYDSDLKELMEDLKSIPPVNWKSLKSYIEYLLAPYNAYLDFTAID